MKNFLAVVLLLLGLMALSSALIRDVHQEEDDEEFIDFEARFKKLGALRQQAEAAGEEGEEWSREHLSEALKKLLPKDMDMREAALAKLFMELMGEEEEEFPGRPRRFYGPDHEGEDHGEDFPDFPDRKFPSRR